jgi:hypothetical protein
MQGPAPHPTASGGPHTSLAQRAFPRRVRALLEGVLEYVSDELDRGLTSCLNELEQQLFKLAEQARSNEVQKSCFEALREVKRGRADLSPRFLLGLEAALATLKDPVKREAAPGAGRSKEMSLVEDVVMDETVTLHEIASRAEIRNSLPLFLLGQRFGVIAGRPAFDTETLPIGPVALCQILREATGCLDLNSEHRQHLFRQFDRQVLQFIGPLYETINGYLIKQRILPNLTYVPHRAKQGARPADAPAARGPASDADKRSGEDARGSATTTGGGRARSGAPATTHGGSASPRAGSGPSEGRAGSGAAGGSSPAQQSGTSTGGPSRSAIAGVGFPPAGEASSPKPAQGASAADAPDHSNGHGSGAGYAGPRPLTNWPGTPDPQAGGQSQQDTEMFDVLRQLLAGRRSLLGKLGNAKPGPTGPSHVVSTQDVQMALGQLQGKPAQPVLVEGKPQPRAVTHVKQDLLASLRQVAPEGKAPVLGEEEGDTIDLVGMLFDHIMKDVRPNSPASSLLTKLQVPLLRVALDDKGFFTRKQHPARQMLNTIAESGAYWASDDDADRLLVEKMNMLVDRVGKEFNGDLTLFESLLGDLSSTMQTQARKAEVAERRHVEAARGKEKLELARLRAAEAIDAMLSGKRVPKFLHTLLAQGWTDVLALSMLRGGEKSDTFQHQLKIAERLIDSAVARRTTGTASIAPTEVPALKQELEEALGQVGYHANDAQAVTNRLLVASSDEEDDDPASRTELAMRLKSRTRLGGAEVSSPTGEKLAPLDAAEKACLDQIRHLPFGSWFEFTVNQQGERVRRRLSWYSTVTGHCLFVNHRGQRIGEYSLNWLAREMNRGNLKVVAAEQDSMIDRAWSAIVGALRSFAGRPAAAAAAPATP